MRAGQFLDALSVSFAIDLLVVPVSAPISGDAVPDFVAERVNRVEVVGLDRALDPHYAIIANITDPAQRDAALAAYPRPYLSRYATGRGVAYVETLFGKTDYAAVHVFRVYMAPYAGPLLNRPVSPLVVLDLDELDSASHRRLAQLERGNDRPDEAAVLDCEAVKFGVFEGEWLPRFDRVVCSSDEEAANTVSAAAPVAVIPNTVSVAPDGDADAPAGARFLFVGSMGYAPNDDAVHFFATCVWPSVCGTLGESAQLTVVGSHPSRAVRDLAARPGIDVTGAVPDVAPYYARSSVVVVPIRAGGGTRIKILEAFAHGRPVVSTRAGAAGLCVAHGADIWLADTAEDMAAACVRLAGDPGLARRIVAGGRRSLAAHYDRGKIAQDIRALFASDSGF